MDEEQEYCPECGKSSESENQRAKNLNKKTLRKLKIIVASCVVSVAAVTTLTVFCLLKMDPNRNPETDIPAFTLLTEDFTDKTITDQTSALLALQDAADSVGIKDVAEEFKECKSDTVLGNTYYRFSQEYEGIPVYGRDMIVAADENGKAVLLTGNYKDISSVKIDPKIEESEAIALVQEKENANTEVMSNGLVIYSLYGYAPEVAWELYTTTDAKAKCILISANNGKIISEESLLDSSQVICGGLDMNGKSQNFFAEYENEKYILKDTRRDISIYDANGGTLSTPGLAIKDSNDNEYRKKDGNWYDEDGNIVQPEGDDNFSIIVKDEEGQVIGEEGILMVELRVSEPFAKIDAVTSENQIWDNPKAVTLMSSLCKIYDYWENQFGRHSFDNMYGAINGVINDFKNGDTTNAQSFSDPNVPIAVISMGSNNSMSFEVIAHEFTHAVENTISALMGTGEAGALKEAYGDIFAELIGASLNNGYCDWIYDGNRSLIDPPSGKDSLPKIYHDGERWVDTVDTSEANDRGGVHSNCTVVSHAAYLMASGKNTAFSPLSTDEIAELFYSTLYILPQDCSFSEFRALMECMARIQQTQGKLENSQALGVTAAFDAVQIPRLLMPTAHEFELDVYDYKGEPYEDYTLYLSYGSQEDTYSGSDVSNGTIKLDKTGVYTVWIVDNKDETVQTDFAIEVIEQGGTEQIPVFLSSGFKEDFAGLTPTPSSAPETTIPQAPAEAPYLGNSNEKTESEYKEFIVNREYEQYTSESESIPTEYAILDVDQDGIDELLMAGNTADDFKTVWVFTFDGEVKYIDCRDFYYGVQYSSTYKALAGNNTRPTANSTVFSFWSLQNGALIENFSVAYGYYEDIKTYDDPQITQYTDTCEEIAFLPLLDLIGTKQNNKIELAAYIDNFDDLDSLVGGSAVPDPSYHGFYHLAENGNMDYSRTEDDSRVMQMTITETTKYQLFGTYIGQEASIAQNTLTGNGWELTQNTTDMAEYYFDSREITLRWDDTNTIARIEYRIVTASGINTSSGSIIGIWETEYEGEPYRIQFTEDKRAIAYEPDGYGGYDENVAYYRLNEPNGILQIYDEYGEELEEPWYYSLKGDILTINMGRTYDVTRVFRRMG